MHLVVTFEDAREFADRVTRKRFFLEVLRLAGYTKFISCPFLLVSSPPIKIRLYVHIRYRFYFFFLLVLRMLALSSPPTHLPLPRHPPCILISATADPLLHSDQIYSSAL